MKFKPLSARITPSHPLRRLFADLVCVHFHRDAQVGDPAISEYVSAVLVDFAHVDSLFKIRNTRGRPLEDVGEMLIESHPLLEASSFIREREVRKHIGDYTLFLAGMFPEYVAALPRRRPLRLDALVDYIQAGKESYAIVSSFDQFEYRREAPLFRRLSRNFELCVYGLNLVKQDLERLQHDYCRRLRSAFESPA